MGSMKDAPTPSADAKPKRQPPRPRNEPRQVAPTPPPAPPPAPDISGGTGSDLRSGGSDRLRDARRRGTGGPNRVMETVEEAQARPLGGDWGLMAKAPTPPPAPTPGREDRPRAPGAFGLDPKPAQRGRAPGFRPDMADEGPRSERRQSEKSPGATADRHSKDNRQGAPRRRVGRHHRPSP